MSEDLSDKARVIDDENELAAPIHDDIGLGGMFADIPMEVLEHEYLKPRLTSRREKSWGERLTFETGVCYLSGIFIGGSIGAVQGWRKPGPTNFKLKMNSILNGSGRLGSRTGNTFGVFALTFSLSKSLVKYQRRKDDIMNDILGVGMAGTVVALPKGPLTALAVGGVMCSAASIMVYGRQFAEAKLKGSRY